MSQPGYVWTDRRQRHSIETVTATVVTAADARVSRVLLQHTKHALSLGEPTNAHTTTNTHSLLHTHIHTNGYLRIV